ncbi:unnamed protein product [Acidithrix sp. C25]|nr:unnamed protein product [Acidithrix sp. C25]
MHNGLGLGLGIKGLSVKTLSFCHIALVLDRGLSFLAHP